MKAINKQPKIRFKGFTDAWEQRKLEDVAEKSNGGGTPSTANLEYWKGDIPWIQSSDILDGDILNVKPKKHITKEALKNSSAKLISRDSIAIITRVGVGKLAIIPFCYSTSQDFLSLSNLKTDKYFAAYYIYNMLQLDLNKVQGTSIKGITKDELLAKRIYLPKLEEQIKVGKIFSELDKSITLHQRKCEELKLFKKSMLAKMFPKEGESVPEVRFAGFTGEWSFSRLKDFGDTYTGLSGKTKKDFGHGEARFITYMNVFKNSIIDSSIFEPIEIDTKQNEVKKGDIFFTVSSETPEEVGMASVLLDEKGITYLNSFCFGYRLKRHIDSYYLVYMLRSKAIRDKITLLAQGISRYNLSKNKLMNIKVPLPTIEEQQKIGSYFKHLDDMINLHQQKVENLQNIKKSLLDNMFV